MLLWWRKWAQHSLPFSPSDDDADDHDDAEDYQDDAEDDAGDDQNDAEDDAMMPKMIAIILRMIMVLMRCVEDFDMGGSLEDAIAEKLKLWVSELNGPTNKPTHVG